MKKFTVVLFVLLLVAITATTAYAAPPPPSFTVFNHTPGIGQNIGTSLAWSYLGSSSANKLKLTYEFDKSLVSNPVSNNCHGNTCSLTATLTKMGGAGISLYVSFKGTIPGEHNIKVHWTEIGGPGRTGTEIGTICVKNPAGNLPGSCR